MTTHHKAEPARMFVMALASPCYTIEMTLACFVRLFSTSSRRGNTPQPHMLVQNAARPICQRPPHRPFHLSDRSRSTILFGPSSLCFSSSACWASLAHSCLGR